MRERTEGRTLLVWNTCAKEVESGERNQDSEATRREEESERFRRWR